MKKNLKFALNLACVYCVFSLLTGPRESKQARAPLFQFQGFVATLVLFYILLVTFDTLETECLLTGNNVTFTMFIQI